MRALSPAPSLPERAADDLRRAIRDGRFDEVARLPSEPELARRLRVSRATVRHAVSILEEEGLLSRRQGIGTFVVRRVSEIRNNINANLGVTDLIEAAGWTPGTRGLTVTEEPARADTLQALGLPSRSGVICIRRIRVADGRPVAYTIDYLPTRLLAERAIGAGAIADSLRVHESLYEALERIGIVVHHGTAKVSPAQAEDETARELQIAPGSLLLLLDQVDYAADGEPVLHSHEYHVANLLSVQVYRKGPGARLKGDPHAPGSEVKGIAQSGNGSVPGRN